MRRAYACMFKSHTEIVDYNSKCPTIIQMHENYRNGWYMVATLDTELVRQIFHTVCSVFTVHIALISLLFVLCLLFILFVS